MAAVPEEAAPELRRSILEALDKGKGGDICSLDVRSFSVPVDYMILVSGTSPPHVRALARRAEEAALGHGTRPRGVEGRAPGEWLLLDFDILLVHIMLPGAREFYDLEGLWQLHPGEGGAQDS